jgi:hypothetical protein
MFLGFLATWSPRPFDDFHAEPDDGRAFRRLLGLSTAQWIGIVGGSLLALGTFLPTFGVGPRSSLLLEVDLEHDGLPIDGLLVLALGITSVVLAVRNLCVLLWLTAIFAQMAMASSYVLWEPAVCPVPWEFCCFRRPDAGLRAGWWVMELGLLLLLVAGFLGDLPPLRHWKPMPPATDRFPASGGMSPT